MIRKVRKEDTPAITAIYNHYIAHTTITFELEPVSEEEMWTRIQHISEKYPYFVYETEGQIAATATCTDGKKRLLTTRVQRPPSTWLLRIPEKVSEKN